MQLRNGKIKSRGQTYGPYNSSFGRFSPYSGMCIAPGCNDGRIHGSKYCKYHTGQRSFQNHAVYGDVDSDADTVNMSDGPATPPAAVRPLVCPPAPVKRKLVKPKSVKRDLVMDMVQSITRQVPPHPPTSVKSKPDRPYLCLSPGCIAAAQNGGEYCSIHQYLVRRCIAGGCTAVALIANGSYCGEHWDGTQPEPELDSSSEEEFKVNAFGEKVKPTTTNTKVCQYSGCNTWLSNWAKPTDCFCTAHRGDIQWSTTPRVSQASSSVSFKPKAKKDSVELCDYQDCNQVAVTTIRTAAHQGASYDDSGIRRPVCPIHSEHSYSFAGETVWKSQAPSSVSFKPAYQYCAYRGCYQYVSIMGLDGTPWYCRVHKPVESLTDRLASGEPSVIIDAADKPKTPSPKIHYPPKLCKKKGCTNQSMGFGSSRYCVSCRPKCKRCGDNWALVGDDLCKSCRLVTPVESDSDDSDVEYMGTSVEDEKK